MTALASPIGFAIAPILVLQLPDTNPGGGGSRSLWGDGLRRREVRTPTEPTGAEAEPSKRTTQKGRWKEQSAGAEALAEQAKQNPTLRVSVFVISCLAMCHHWNKPPAGLGRHANFHSQARSNRLRLAETNRVPATLVHSPRNAIHGRVSGLLGFYKLLKI